MVARGLTVEQTADRPRSQTLMHSLPIQPPPRRDDSAMIC